MTSPPILLLSSSIQPLPFDFFFANLNTLLHVLISPWSLLFIISLFPSGNTLYHFIQSTSTCAPLTDIQPVGLHSTPRLQLDQFKFLTPSTSTTLFTYFYLKFLSSFISLPIYTLVEQLESTSVSSGFPSPPSGLLHVLSYPSCRPVLSLYPS